MISRASCALCEAKRGSTNFLTKGKGAKPALPLDITTTPEAPGPGISSPVPSAGL
jgi:hypothetical protein